MLFIIGAASLGATLAEFFDAKQDERIAAQTLAGARWQAREQTIRLSTKQIEAANRVMRQLNLPWQPLLSAIEEQLSERVALLSIEPDASTQRLRLQAEAKSADDMVDFIEALDGDERFVTARLVRHEIYESDRNRPYRFILEAEWSADL